MGRAAPRCWRPTAAVFIGLLDGNAGTLVRLAGSGWPEHAGLSMAGPTSFQRPCEGSRSAVDRSACRVPLIAACTAKACGGAMLAQGHLLRQPAAFRPARQCGRRGLSLRASAVKLPDHISKARRAKGRHVDNACQWLQRWPNRPCRRPCPLAGHPQGRPGARQGGGDGGEDQRRHPAAVLGAEAADLGCAPGRALTPCHPTSPAAPPMVISGLQTQYLERSQLPATGGGTPEAGSLQGGRGKGASSACGVWCRRRGRAGRRPGGQPPAQL